MSVKKTGARTRNVLGKRITEAEWVALSDTERDVFLTAERLLESATRGDRSLIGLELGKSGFPGREDYVTWLRMPGNLARGKRMIAKWFKSLR